MARLESIAVGGYYPTPPSVILLIARLLDAGERAVFLDPCAGDGAAVLSLVDELKIDKVDVHAIELEKTRHAALAESIGRKCGFGCGRDALHGDAFKVSFAGQGATLLYLNPPYDLDPEHGRLEERFLSRFTAALADGGILVFLVPFYALKASARTLATEYEDVRCYRFPDEEFGAYKQVALFAERRSVALWEPDPAVLADVERWAEDASTCPVLGEGDEPRYALPTISTWYRAFADEWRVRELDLAGLLAATAPWSQTDRSGKRTPLPGIVPEGALEDLLVRKYPLAMPPRPAHIAAGIAAGIFNGAKILPDDPASPLPALLVKGVFDKEFRKIDEKKDKDGTTKAVVEIQQPKLVTTVLDLSTSRYVTIKSSAERTDCRDIEKMTMADLLAVYGRGLMQTMLAQCPVMHEPARDGDAFALPELARPLFHAQKHAVMAAVKLLGGPGVSKRARRRKSAFVLGEIGSGKTSVALATSRAVDAKRTLVLCPPHLLTSWADQVKAVVPWVRTVVLSDVADVQRLAADDDPSPVVAVLSRETAKLGHAYQAVARCGECGASAPPDVDHAKKRSRCQAQRIVAKGPLGRIVRDLSYDLARVFPEDARVRQIVRGPASVAATRWAEAKKQDESWESREWSRLVSKGTLDRLLDHLLEKACVTETAALEALELFLWADPVPELLLGVARALYAARPTEKTWSVPSSIFLARRLLLFVPDVDVEEFRALDEPEWDRYGGGWQTWKDHRAFLRGEGTNGNSWGMGCTRSDDGKICKGKHELGDRRVALDAFAMLANASLRLSRECGAPLFQAVPEPRRFPLATYIAKKHPALFDLLILDEGHEYATDGSAQERSAHRLTSLGIPTLLLTGTVMNGYAESLFTNMWALSESFRREFARDERVRFIDRYGYRKRLVEDRDKTTGKVVEYGSMSDRVERSERMIGDAPGVLPVFLLKYLLPMSVTLHKTDLAIDIPRCEETTERVKPETKQERQFRALQETLLAAIKRDRFSDRAGQLWGALAEMPSYLDCCTEDVGNRDDGKYEIAYPDGPLVASAEPLPASMLLPKEKWLLRHLEEAFRAGRRALVFAWHTRLIPRIARIIEEHTGQKAVVLHASKVPTAKRQDWIDREVIGKKRRVMICNPVTVQTGLNNLVYFADEVWLENPACNPVVYRQAVGRVDRIGQKLPTKIVFPLYEGTSQQELHSLLLQKVAVSMSADGLDGESAMQAAGIGEEGFSSFSVGRQLYDLLTKDGVRAA